MGVAYRTLLEMAYGNATVRCRTHAPMGIQYVRTVRVEGVSPRRVSSPVTPQVTFTRTASRSVLHTAGRSIARPKPRSSKNELEQRAL